MTQYFYQSCYSKLLSQQYDNKNLHLNSIITQHDTQFKQVDVQPSKKPGTLLLVKPV